MSWKDILKSKEEIEAYERTLDKSKEKAKSRKYTPDTRESIDAILSSLERKLARLKQLDELDGSEVAFEETMDRLSYFINLNFKE